MENDVQVPLEGRALRCPGCGQSDRFRIAAVVWITVAGADSADELARDSDADYGSEDPCRCPSCGHQAAMGEFYADR